MIGISFKVLAPDGLQLFRAPSPSGRLDWVAAFAVVATVHELGIWKTPPLPPQSPPSPTSGSRDAPQLAGEGAGAEVGGAIEKDDTAGATKSGARWGFGVRTERETGRGAKIEKGQGEREKCEDGNNEEEGEGEDQGGAWGETAAIGGRIAAAGGTSGGGGAKVTAPPRSVMQGFLRKRAVGRLWGASEGWEYRWVVLRVSE